MTEVTEGTDYTSRVLVRLRLPSAGQPQLVITENGQNKIIELGFNTTRVLASDAVYAVATWPIDKITS